MDEDGPGTPLGRGVPASNAEGVVKSAALLQNLAIKGALWTILHVIISVPIAFIANAIIARALGVADYGRLAFLTIVLSIAIQVSHLGFGDGVIQWGAAAHARGDEKEVRGLLRKSMGYHVLVQLPLLLITILFIARRESLFVIIALVISVSIPAVLGSAALTITIESRSAASAKLAMASNFITQVFTTSAAVLTHSAAVVWASRSAMGAILVPLNFLALDKAGRRVALQLAVPRRLPAGFWRFCIFSAAGGLVGMLVFSRSELLVLQSFDAVRAAGLYALAFGLAQQVTAPVDALLNPLGPAVSGIVEAHPERIPVTVLRATRVGSLLCAGIATLVLPALYILIPVIYGDQFREAAPAFFVLALTSCLQSAVNPLLTFARARKQAASLLVINGVALTIDLVVAIATIPMWGLWGALLANAAGQITVFTLLVRMECRAWDIPLSTYISANATFLAAGTGALAVLAMDAAGSPPILSVVGAAACATVFAVAAARWAGGAIPVSDLSPVLRLLPMRVQSLVLLLLRPVTSASVD